MPFDAHIHLDQYEAGERERLLDAAFQAGIDGIVAVSMDMASCLENRRLAMRYPGRIMPAYGYHPEQPPLPEDELEKLCRWIWTHRDEPFAIGEVGLPYYLRKKAEDRGEPFDLAPYMRQLERFVRLARDLNRPLVLHAVYEDADAALDLLERYGIRKAHFHWFKGSAQTVARMAAGGYFVSFTPDVRYERDIRELAKSYPLELTMAETDGPWPFAGPYAGRRTEPVMVLDVIREIASLRGMDEAHVRRCLDDNTKRFYEWTAEP